MRRPCSPMPDNGPGDIAKKKNHFSPQHRGRTLSLAVMECYRFDCRRNKWGPFKRYESFERDATDDGKGETQDRRNSNGNDQSGFSDVPATGSLYDDDPWRFSVYGSISEDFLHVYRPPVPTVLKFRPSSTHARVIVWLKRQTGWRVRNIPFFCATLLCTNILYRHRGTRAETNTPLL